MSGLHWNPNVERKGLGNLIKKVNHVAIIVSDISKSLDFYVEKMGFQQIKRPNFDRYGAWLTMGNCELHLIKGVPVVFEGDNLIVGHISIETDDVDAVLAKLKEMKIPFIKNVSVPDAAEIKPITQYFLKDPDGYYLEICNCDILTAFCLEKDTKGVAYQETTQQLDMSLAFSFLAKVEEISSNVGTDVVVPPEDKWAKEADPVKVQNMLKRTKIYGDPLQAETLESISDALLKANNHVPLAVRIIRANKKSTSFLPPAIYLEGETRYQPKFIPAPKTDKPIPKDKQPYLKIVYNIFSKYDKNKDGKLDREEIRKTLIQLRQNPDSEAIKKFFAKDMNDDGTIDFHEFFEAIQTQALPNQEEQMVALFNLIDIDGNVVITTPELQMILKEMDVPVSDELVEIIMTEADLDGSGTLNLQELQKFVLS